MFCFLHSPQSDPAWATGGIILDFQGRDEREGGEGREVSDYVSFLLSSDDWRLYVSTADRGEMLRSSSVWTHNTTQER